MINITSKKFRSSDYELVRDIEDKNSRWMDAESKARDRMFEAIRGFVDIDGGSWPKEAVLDMEKQGRHVASINVAKQKLETLHGSIFSQRYDFNFTPLDNNQSTLTEGIKHWYYADKDDYDYTRSESEALLGGLLHSATAEIDVDYKKRKTGGIVFRTYQSGQILKDPYWETDNNEDWREAIKHGWFTPRQIIDKYETDDPDIQTQAFLDEQAGYIYEDTDDPEKTKYAPFNIGSRYLVIEYRWLETFKATRLHVCTPDGNMIPLPVKITEDQVRSIIQNLGLSADDIREYPYEDDILYYATVCPSLSNYTILASGKYPVQCGNIGFFRYSAMRMGTVEKGMWEYIQDIQRMLNYRHSKIDDVIASAAAGLTLVDYTRLPKGEKGLREIENKKTRPDGVIGVQGNPQNIAALFPVQQVPEHLFREVNNLIDLFDRVSPVTPALEGAASADESGILFEMRHAVTKLGTYRLQENWKRHLLDRAKAWYNLSPIVYKGVYRKVKRTDLPGFIEFNAEDYRNGERVIINSIETLPEASVVVSLSSQSPTEQMSKRLQLTDMNKIFSANPQEFKAEIRLTNHELIKTLPLDPELKAYYDTLFSIQKDTDLLEEIARRERTIADMSNSKFATAQSQMMLEQIKSQQQAPMQGGQPQTPEAISQESIIGNESAPPAPEPSSREQRLQQMTPAA